MDAGVCLGFISTETGPNWRNATKHKNPGSLTAQHFAGIHGNWRNKTIIIRNQQVMCSSHTTSSKKHRKLRFSMLFCCKKAEKGVGQNVGQLPDPHRDPHRLAASGFAAYCQLMPHGYNEMRGKSQRAPERKLLPFRCSACLWDLANLRHEAAHFLRGLLLHLPCGVGVGAEGESCVVVTEH